jgi:hypothetical protein
MRKALLCRMYLVRLNSQSDYFRVLYLIFNLFARDTTPVPPIALVLFGGSLSASQKLSTSRPGEALLSVDGWITVSVSARVQKLLVLVRQHLDNLLQDKVSDPTATFSAGSEKLLAAIVALLEEGEQEKDIALEPPSAYQDVQQVALGWGADPTKIAMANKLLGLNAGRGRGGYGGCNGGVSAGWNTGGWGGRGGGRGGLTGGGCYKKGGRGGYQHQQYGYNEQYGHHGNQSAGVGQQCYKSMGAYQQYQQFPSFNGGAVGLAGMQYSGGGGGFLNPNAATFGSNAPSQSYGGFENVFNKNVGGEGGGRGERGEIQNISYNNANSFSNGNDWSAVSGGGSNFNRGYEGVLGGNAGGVARGGGGSMFSSGAYQGGFQAQVFGGGLTGVGAGYELYGMAGGSMMGSGMAGAIGAGSQFQYAHQGQH